MKYSQIPPKFAIPWGNNAGGGYIDPIPEASQIGIANGRASLADGFPPLNFLPVGAGGIPPFGQDMNGILNQITAWERWQAAGGTPKYDSDYATKIGGYPFGAILAGSTAGILWLNTADDNLTNPESAGVGWVNIGTQAAPFSTGTDAGSANVMTATVSPAPTSYVDGAIFFVKKTGASNNGAMIGSINGLANQPIVNPNGSALTPGQWPASADAILIYRASLSSLVLLTPATTAGPGIAVTPGQVVSLNLPTLPVPVGAMQLTDSLAVRSTADGKDVLQPMSAIIAAVGKLPGQLLASNGYQFFPGGLLLQWMYGPTDPADTSYFSRTLSWPIAFPASCFGAVISFSSAQGSGFTDIDYKLVGFPGVTQVTYFRDLQPGGANSYTSTPFLIALGN